MMRPTFAALALLALSALSARAGIVDHLLRCDSEAACIADPVIGQYYIPADAEGPGHWRGDVTFPGVEVYTLAGDGSRVDFPGWFIWISRPSLDPALRDAANGACRIIADSDATRAQGRNVILYTGPGFDPAVEGTARIEPVPAGGAYVFGGN